jgi:vitamin B12 transporter
VVVSALIAAMISDPAAAQETKRLEPVVVTATKLEEPVERLGAAVTVISEDDLKLYNYESVGDALRQVPGVEIQRSGGPGKLTQIRIRGSRTQQVQILIDGVRAKSPTSGELDFSDLAIDQIERIEIVRGPQSTLHGADAIAGVVNIITKRGKGPFSAFASTEAGNYDTLRERAGFSGSYKLFDYAFGGSWFESNGQFRNDGSEQRAVTARVGLTLPADGHIGLSLRYNRTAIDLPVDFTIPGSPLFVLDPDSKQQSETTTLSLQWDQKPLEWFELHARVGQLWNQLGAQDPFTSGDVAAGNFDSTDQRSQINTQRREVELVMAFHVRKWNTLTLGGEHRTESGRNRSVGFSGPGARETFFKHIETASAFVQDELRLLERLVLSGGWRYDDSSAFGSATTYRAGVAVPVKETGTKLRAAWGEGFRAPTINDLFFPGFANPELEPERSESWEAGLDQKLWRDRVRLGVTYFENKFRNLIQFQSTSVGCPPGNLFGCSVNVGRAWTQGVEFTGAVDILDNLLFTANYTYVDTQDVLTKQELRRVPHHVYNFGLTWDPLRPLSLFVQANVVSSQFDQVFDPATFTTVGVRNPGYHRINLGGTYHIVERRGAYPALDFTVRLDNATDARIFEVFGFRNLGINVLAGLQARY